MKTILIYTITATLFNAALAALVLKSAMTNNPIQRNITSSQDDARVSHEHLPKNKTRAAHARLFLSHPQKNTRIIKKTGANNGK